MIQVAFYKGRTRLFDRLVQWWTRGPYSHCEIVIDGLCHSSSWLDGGVRVKSIDLASGRWDLVDIEADLVVNEAAVRAWFAQHAGQQYDLAGLLGFVLPWRTEDRRRWFCSEACAEALWYPRSWTISPNRLARMLATGDPHG